MNWATYPKSRVRANGDGVGSRRRPPGPRAGRAAHQGGQGRQVVDVLEALADGFEDDREGRVLDGDLEQRGRALALLPQRRATARIAPGEQQRAGGALAEAGREQRRAADLLGHQRVDLVGLEDDDVAGGRLGVGVGDPDHDAVVGRDRLAVHAVALPEPGIDRERPRRVHRDAVRRVHDEPPVAELVAEPLDEERLVAGQQVGGLELLVQVADQVGRGVLIQSLGARALSSAARGSAPSSRVNAPIAWPSSAGRPRVSPFQNGSRPGMPGAGVTSTRSWVMSSIRQLVAPRAKMSPTRDS